MIFDDDHVEIRFAGGTRRYRCRDLNDAAKNLMDGNWPPPEFLFFGTFKFKRVAYSTISDEDRAAMSYVVRGAVYEPVGQRSTHFDDVATIRHRDGQQGPTDFT